MSKKVVIPENHHIYEHQKSWLVQIKNRGKIKTKNFSYQKYNGKENALIEAKKFRDNFIKENKIKLSERFVKAEIEGVGLTTDKRKNGNASQYWQAIGVENGKQVTKRFSINKYGFEEAKNLAIQARETLVRGNNEGESTLFTAPENKNIKLWRYMDFTKFIYMLEKSALFFSQVDNLGDPYEGELSRGNNTKFENLEREIKRIKPNILVSCWHINKTESAAMWKLYSKSNEAICIQTTYNKFRRALDNDIKIGRVKYIDYDKDWIPESDLYYPFIYKRNSFEHEHELRGLIDLSKVDLSKNKKIEIVKGGAWVKVHMSNLIEGIYVAPDSPVWFKSLVEKVKMRYNLMRKVVYQSGVLYKPS
jgi:hypothetical protein